MTRARGEGGSAVVIALLSVTIMILLGFAVLTITDQQARQSGKERLSDQAFNMAESVLTDQAFVMGRSWPDSAPTPDPACSAAGAGFTDTLGSTGTPSQAVKRLQDTIKGMYPDAPYYGQTAPWSNASWQVNVCDNAVGSSVWSDSLLSNKTWDANHDDQVWVRAQATVHNTTRVVVALVNVLEVPVFDSRYGLVSGTVNDDLGTTINGVNPTALGPLLSNVLGSVPAVASDPTQTATIPPSSGVTGVRCGALDLTLTPPRTCLSGTLGATAAIPLVSTLVTGGKLEQFPRTTTIAPADADRLRAQANASHTYYSSSAGASTAAAAPACTFTTNTGTRSASTVVFIEKVGGGDDYCYVDVSSGVLWKALVIGSGRVIIRGDGASTGTPSFVTPDSPQRNTFTGVVYALNNQRKDPPDGLGLGDSATAPREVVRIEKGAHVKGEVAADGLSGKVTIIPPEPTINYNTLIEALVPCTVVLGITNCTLQNTLKAVLAASGTTVLVNQLITTLGLNAVTSALTAQVQPQVAAYGSAIVADVNAIRRVTVYGPSGIVTGTFGQRPS